MSKEAKASKVEEENAETTEIVCNGLTLCGITLPTEILLTILRYVDHKSLLSCQLVCKYWRDLIRDEVLPNKAAVVSGRKLSSDHMKHWQENYLIGAGQPFDTNLIRNHSGELKFEGWLTSTPFTSSRIVNRLLSIFWGVEHPLENVPELIDDLTTEGRDYCFVTKYGHCIDLVQYVDLVAMGFSGYVLDKMQPYFDISEWCSREGKALLHYVQTVELLNERDEIMRTQELDIPLTEENKWYRAHVTIHEYGPGVRGIRFIHMKRYDNSLDDDAVLKTAGASIKLKFLRYHE